MPNDRRTYLEPIPGEAVQKRVVHLVAIDPEDHPRGHACRMYRGQIATQTFATMAAGHNFLTGSGCVQVELVSSGNPGTLDRVARAVAKEITSQGDLAGFAASDTVITLMRNWTSFVEDGADDPRGRPLDEVMADDLEAVIANLRKVQGFCRREASQYSRVA